MNYWYISKSYDGWQNLALDEWFLDHLCPDDVLLYFYINENAVIIGKNQNPWQECRLDVMERDKVQLVRRVSGGGAVYHDLGNLNFSFLMGEAVYDVTRQMEVIRKAIASFGKNCEFSGRNDLLCDGKKFSGNAFCQRGHIRQHHGTLLLNSDLEKLQHYLTPDPKKLTAKGVSSVRARVMNLELPRDAVIDAVLAAFQEEYGTARPLEKVHDVTAYYQKHSSDTWRLDKTPSFDLELSQRFSWGGIRLLLTLKEGKVSQVQLYTDAMDEGLPEKVQAALLGVPCNSAALADALKAWPELAEFVKTQGL